MSLAQSNLPGAGVTMRILRDDGRTFAGVTMPPELYSAGAIVAKLIAAPGLSAAEKARVSNAVVEVTRQPREPIAEGLGWAIYNFPGSTQAYVTRDDGSHLSWGAAQTTFTPSQATNAILATAGLSAAEQARIMSMAPPTVVINQPPVGFFLNGSANPKLRAMLTRRTGKIVWMGDSTDVGVGAGTGQYYTINARPYRVPNVLASLLTATGRRALDRGIAGDAGMAITGSGDLASYDTRVTLNNMTSTGGENFPGGDYIQGNDGGWSYAFAETSVDTFVIDYLASNSGSATIKIDGAAPASGPTNITPGAGNGFITYTVKAASVGNHTVTISGPDRTIAALRGVRAYDSTTAAIDIVVLAAGGATTANQAAVAGAPQNWYCRDALAYEAPDLTVIGPYFNDPNNNVPLNTTITNLQSLITTAKVSGDVLLLSKYPAGGAYGTGQSAANTAIKNLAAQNNVACMSEFDYYGGAFTAAIQARLADGVVHSKADFQAEQAGLIRDSILYGMAA